MKIYTFFHILKVRIRGWITKQKESRKNTDEMISKKRKIQNQQRTTPHGREATQTEALKRYFGA